MSQSEGEKRSAYQKIYRASNKEKLNASRKAYAIANPDRTLDWKLKHYGITAEQYRKMLADQGGVCAICKGPPTGRTSELRPYHVDHCHKTNKVRGLLCHHCNLLIGQAKDSIERLEKAIKYLERFYGSIC